MKLKLSQQELISLKKAIDASKNAYKSGNYPVGAVLTVDDKIIGIAGNKIFEKNSFTNHAELSLIIRNGSKLFEAYKENKIIKLFSTLEPCIQCLGASVTNHVNKIVYITKDPNGGACNLKYDNIGDFYKNHWPEIIYAPISDQPLNLMRRYFQKEITKGNTEWPRKMLRLYTLKS
jgi:tRNA(adenine34) deaminase